MGIDPGTSVTGYALARRLGDQRLLAVEYGVIRTARDLPLSQRLGLICGAVEELGRAHLPEAIAVEEVFFGRSARNVFAVGQARGAILVGAAKLGLPVYEYSAPQVKQAVTGYGRADKRQVQQMIKVLFALPEAPRPDDAADALAVCACCLYSQRMEEVLGRSSAGAAAARTR
jgi:crossover junction endodeoxyribonuclease RuvC